MPRRYGFPKASSHRRKTCEKLEANSRKPWRIACTRICIILTMFSLFFSFYGLVGADYVMPAPPQEIVITETSISLSFTTPSRSVFINVTEYNACPIVKNVTVDFREPVTYIGFILEVLSESPNYEDLPRNETVFQQYKDSALQYYTIRLLTEHADEITNVKMIFALEKTTAQERDAVTLSLYQYDGRNMEECQTEKFEEDSAFSYFRTATAGSSYIAITRVLTPTPWWFVVVIIAIIALLAVMGIYMYKRFKLTNL
jgi:PGF-pre-PGF domain-containing protein